MVDLFVIVKNKTIINLNLYFFLLCIYTYKFIIFYLDIQIRQNYINLFRECLAFLA
jgi:hypothetical protein